MEGVLENQYRGEHMEFIGVHMTSDYVLKKWPELWKRGNAVNAPYNSDSTSYP